MRERRLITYWSHLLHRGTSRYFPPTSAVPNKTRRKSHPAFYLVPNSPLWLLPIPIQIAIKTFPRAHDLQMCRWVHYKRELEKAVAFYRSGGGSDGNRIPIGVAFMTTHSLASDRLEGRYATRVREYEDGFEPRLAMCRERVSIGLVASITLNRLPRVASLLPLTFTLSRRHDLVSPWSEHRLQLLFFESRCTSGKPINAEYNTHSQLEQNGYPRHTRNQREVHDLTHISDAYIRCAPYLYFVPSSNKFRLVFPWNPKLYGKMGL